MEYQTEDGKTSIDEEWKNDPYVAILIIYSA